MHWFVLVLWILLVKIILLVNMESKMYLIRIRLWKSLRRIPMAVFFTKSKLCKHAYTLDKCPCRKQIKLEKSLERKKMLKSLTYTKSNLSKVLLPILLPIRLLIYGMTLKRMRDTRSTSLMRLLTLRSRIGRRG